MEFVDGTSAPADLLVWATGYRVSFPFLAPGTVPLHDNDLPLWKRLVHPDVPGLYFLGLLQPIGAVMPLAEAQARLLVDLFTGRYRLPDPRRMRRQMTADHERFKRRFYPGARHTMEVDFDHYLWELRRERRRGAVPDDERPAGRRTTRRSGRVGHPAPAGQGATGSSEPVR